MSGTGKSIKSLSLDHLSIQFHWLKRVGVGRLKPPTPSVDLLVSNSTASTSIEYLWPLNCVGGTAPPNGK